MYLYAYNEKSKSAKELSNALGIKRLKHVGESKKVDTLINWGASKIDREIEYNEIVNRPIAVARAVDKLQAFKWIEGSGVAPPFTESRVEASRWLAEGVCKEVVCRTKLNGHSGAGIVMANTIEKLVPAPLYVQYIPKKEEYRLHVHNEKVFFIQRKARNKAIPDDEVNWKIRNHGNGFIFAHKGVDVPEEAKQAAITAVAFLGLDFGAVDIILGTDGEWYVLEVNCAPGIEPGSTTLEKYVEQFKQYV